MKILFAFSLILFVAFILILLHPTEADIESLHKIFKKRQSLRKLTKLKKQSKLRKLFTDTDEMMKMTNQGGIYRLIFFCIITSAAGVFIAVFLNNFILLPILGFIGFSIPFFWVRVHYINYSQLILDELEPTLSLITTSYERSNNILQAFEENLPYIQEPIKPIFAEFVHKIKHVSPDVEKAIEEMKPKINHSVFVEWCDALKNCASNHTLKYTLSPIVAKLTEIKVVNGELKNILFSSLRTYYVMLTLTIILTIIALFVFPPFLELTLPDFVINIIMAVDILVMTFCTMKVYIETKSVKSDI